MCDCKTLATAEQIRTIDNHRALQVKPHYRVLSENYFTEREQYVYQPIQYFVLRDNIYYTNQPSQIDKETQTTEFKYSNTHDMEILKAKEILKSIRFQLGRAHEAFNKIEKQETLRNGQASKLWMMLQQNNSKLKNLKSLALQLISNQREFSRKEVEHLKQEHQQELEKIHKHNAEEISRIKSEKEEIENKMNTALEEISALKQQLECTKNHFQTIIDQEKIKYEDTVKALNDQLKEKENIIKELEEETTNNNESIRRMKFKVDHLKGNIKVMCRVRPFLKGEKEESAIVYSTTNPKKIAVVSNRIFGKNTALKHWFKFDKVLNHEATQKDSFNEVSDLVKSALDGYKVCLFAYGQTGSGKTFTMQGEEQKGNEELRGVIPRSVEYLFEIIEQEKKKGWEYKLEASFLEIYNDKIQDLLISDKMFTFDTDYNIEHNDKGETRVKNLTYVDVTDPKQIHELLKIAAKNRAIGETSCNMRSSRSHSIFTLRIVGENLTTNTKSNGVLNIIDLAGSERLSKSNATGMRLRETQHINKSLSTLGDVIHALVYKRKHIPFRNSKLTYYLQNCLTKEAKVLMIVNISPLASCASESISSLQFANKVNACVLDPLKNIEEI